MATNSSALDSWFSVIMSSDMGEDVRDAIINAARNLQKLSMNTNHLNGIYYENFATWKEFSDYKIRISLGQQQTETQPEIKPAIGFDSYEKVADHDYAITSENIVNSGNLYAILVNYIRPSLAYVIHYENDPEDLTADARIAIKDYIASLQIAKDNIVAALKSKGYQDPETHVYKSLKPENCDCMREFAELIDKIGTGTPELVSGGTFNKQKEYDAGDGAAYSSFKVECSDFVQSKTFNENKTYTADEGKLFAKTINVSVNTRSSTRGGISGRTTGSSASDLTEDGFLSSIEITENGHWSAADELVPGVLSITTNVTVPDVAGQVFTVHWTDEQGNSYGSSKVEAYGIARYDGDTPVSSEPGKVFSGWDPAPFFVTSDLTCFARFKPEGSGEPVEIEDDWDVIFANRGEPYEKGSYKTLSLGTINGYNYGNLVFMKVAEGEDSTTSTWITKSTHNLRSGVTNEAVQWPCSPVRNFLNGQFIKDLSQGNTNAKLLAKVALPVRKKTLTAFKNSPILYSELWSEDTFWIPSARELVGMLNYTEVEELRWRAMYNGQRPDGTWGSWGTGKRATGLAIEQGTNPPWLPETIEHGCYIDSYGMDYSKAFTDGTNYGTTLSYNVEWDSWSTGTNPARVKYTITDNVQGVYPTNCSTRTYGVYRQYGEWRWSSHPDAGAVSNFQYGFCM